MLINLVFDANAAAAPQSFRNGVQAGANILDAAILDPITVNIAVGYGEYGLNTPSYETLPGGISLGGVESDVQVSYPALKAALAANETSAAGAASVSQLPNTASLGGDSNFYISTALAKALGAVSATATAIDGYVGFPSNFTGTVLVGAAVVEEAHALGLLYFGGDLGLFSYSSPGTHYLGSGGTSAYFSLDGGNTDLGNYDVGFDDTLFKNLPNDGFDVPVQTTDTLTPLDLSELSAIGFDVASTPTLPTPTITPVATAAGTTATVTAQNVSVPETASISAVSLVKSVSAPAGDGIAYYGFEDTGATGGYFSIGGVAEPDNKYVYVLSTQLATLQYVAGSSTGTETVFIDAYDSTANRFTSSSTAVVTTTSPSAVISGYYQAILGRSADPGGLASYVSAVMAGASYAQVAAALANSAEAQADISAIYQAELGRPADAPGLAYFTQVLATGGSLTGIRGTIATTPEAQTDITRLYQAELGRAADTAGLAAFTQYLAGGGSLKGIAGAIAATPEAQADIAGIYQAELGRRADTAGLAAFTQFLATGGSLAGTETSLATSGEAQADLVQIYQAELGRAADAAGLAGFTQFLAGGGSLATVDGLLASSGEAQADIARIFQAELGRPVDTATAAGFTRYLAAGGSLTGGQASLAGSAEAQADIGNSYQAVLGRAADPVGLSAQTALLANTGSLAAVRTALATSGEAQTDVSNLLRTDTGAAPSATAVSAGQTQLADGLSLADLNTQTLNLASTPTAFLGLAGGTTTAPASGAAVFGFAPGSFGQNTIAGFNPAKDVLELSQSQFPTLASVQADLSQTAGGSVITLDAKDSITLSGVSATSLVHADFRFV